MENNHRNRRRRTVTKVICEEVDCPDNENKICTKKEIELILDPFPTCLNNRAEIRVRGKAK